MLPPNLDRLDGLIAGFDKALRVVAGVAVAHPPPILAHASTMSTWKARICAAAPA